MSRQRSVGKEREAQTMERGLVASVSGAQAHQGRLDGLFGLFGGAAELRGEYVHVMVFERYVGEGCDEGLGVVQPLAVDAHPESVDRGRDLCRLHAGAAVCQPSKEAQHQTRRQAIRP